MTARAVAGVVIYIPRAAGRGCDTHDEVKRDV